MIQSARAVRWAAMVAVLMCGSTSMVWAAGQCQESWEWNNRPAHSGCTAHWIYPGAITFTTAPPLYRHHLGTWAKSQATDRDCHQHTNCTYTDEDEDTFECYWKMQMWENGQWVDKGVPGGNCDCTGANWVTQDFEPRDWPDYRGEYRAKCGVNDTSRDGPNGDDPVQYCFSDSVVLWPPGVTNFHAVSGYPKCGTDKYGNPAPGCLTYQQEWSPTCCGEWSHLDKVTVREYVTYEPAYTSNGKHDFGHNGANCFTGDDSDPIRIGVPGSDGGAFDEYIRLPISKPYKESHCEAYQRYQWASGWESPPPASEDDAGWSDLAVYTIGAFVEYVDGWGWRYRVTREEDECIVGLLE